MSTFLHDSTYKIEITNPEGYTQTRNVNISISDCTEHKSLLVKLKDPDDFSFNFTLNIDKRDFNSMRKEQSLDVDFDDFKTNLIEMLQQTKRQEIFLKCDWDNDKCKLVFYGKSRIKSLIYLTIDLEETNQREIFDEMTKNLNELQAVNKNLKFQLKSSKKLLHDKETQLCQHLNSTKQLEDVFYLKLHIIEDSFSTQIETVTSKLLGKVLKLSQKVLKLIKDLEIVKTESELKQTSSARLLQSLENLRVESIQQSQLIENLQKDNSNLRSLNINHEKLIQELNRNLNDTNYELNEIKMKKDEVENDARQAALIIAQKSASNEDLAKDLVQANQMLVNFNHLYDKKNEELAEMRKLSENKDKAIQDQNNRFHELRKIFEEYQSKFNEEEMAKMSRELFAANKRIEEVEKLNRETTKLNELLTRKLASGDFMQRQFVHQGFNNHN